MATPKVLNGARVKVAIAKGNGGTPKVIGTFMSLSYNVRLDAQSAYILGRYSAASIDYTALETVDITARGWRVVGEGAHAGAGVPTLQDMMNAEDLVFIVTDRATGARIATITDVKAVGHQHEFAVKQQSEMPVNYIGILAMDESGSQSELSGATDPFTEQPI